MTQVISWKKRARSRIAFLLKLLLTLIVLIILYGLCIVFTNGVSEGKLAAGITFLIVLTTGWLFHRLRWLSSRTRLFTCLFVLLTFIVFVVYTIIPVASDEAIKMPADLPGVTTKYWLLKTGSKIAYYQFNAQPGVAKKETPIIFIHGGPGAYVRQLELDFFSTFTAEGYDVYLYDQVGAGRSGQLPKSAYSHKRNIQDFEAILNKINARQYIVIGQSYGASMLAQLTANAVIAKRIAKAIIIEPGTTVKEAEHPVYPKSPNALKDNVDMPFRIFLGFVVNPTGEFTPQNEVINYFAAHTDLTQKIFRNSFPAADSNQIPKVDISVINFSIVGIIPQQVPSYDKHLVEDYKQVHVPTMLMLGESSYIERNAPMDLLAINPNITRSQYIKNAGHILWNGLHNNNQIVKRSMLEFLNDLPPTLPDYPKQRDIKNFLENRL
ncbi:alpha/beta hydrolase [Chitinophaga pinensis]|uniref:Alpha/beta hydrolase fold protein n=1 Tax=Chitinophaga pinensis (strain ATCC 43595 / DSM 2588 / LMG 13176 / NBRC 15968 / NCIMB 11800 / UQM 2034) TaxID=485918 RepID=A0A979GMT6_CHIPD|nr:alpha/beta hydrolase [Chitinophaga pinensis]ACU57648.1 alpha/beta hydrolase fold protein [Chitinophaga pinensis DSM 2588]